MKISFTFEKWQKILKEFSDKVDKKQYHRIPYEKWKKINNCNQVEVYYDSLQNVIQIEACRPGVNREFIEFPMNAGGFGDFLYFNYMRKIEYSTLLDSNSLAASSNLEPNTLYCVLDDDTFTTNTAVNTIEMEMGTESLSTVINTKVDYDDYISTVKALNDEIKDVKKSIEKEKEKEKDMKNFNYDFGPVNTNVVKLSMYGLAIKDKTGSFVSYDLKNNEIMNVDILNFEGAKFLYKMPVAIKDIAIGDIVIHQNVPMFVVGISSDKKTLTAVDPVAGERKEIMLTRSPFGFNFATKIVNLIGDMMGSPSADNPFGNMWMLMALQENVDMNSSMLPLMMINNNLDMNNPMMMYFLMGDNNKNDMLPFLFMMMNDKKECKCGHCEG